MFKKTVIILSVLFLAFFIPSGCKNKDKLTFYDIECTFSGNEISGKETVTFFNSTENSFSALKFNLFPNAFRKDAKYKPIDPQYSSACYYNGESYGGIEIISVYSGKDKLDYTVCGEDDNILSVKLNGEVYPDEKYSVSIEFKTTLCDIIARTGITNKTVNLTSFYPILCGIDNGSFYECVYYSNGDPFFSDVANYVVTLTYPKDYVVASSGKAYKSAETGENYKVSYKINSARSFAFVLSKDFETITDNSLGIEITYYYYNDEFATSSLKTAVQAVKYFCETFGEYPYENYSVVQTEFNEGGMEFPALVFIADNLEEKAYKEVIVHETAHQWWQTTVGNNEVEYGFLDEGLAEYSVLLFYEHHPDYGYTRESLVESATKTYKTFCSVYDKLYNKVDTSMIRPLNSYSSEYEYVNIAYIKPTVMYDDVRNAMGDKRFFKALQNYFETYAMKNARPDDLVAEFSALYKDAYGFFTSYFDGKVII